MQIQFAYITYRKYILENFVTNGCWFMLLLMRYNLLKKFT